AAVERHEALEREGREAARGTGGLDLGQCGLAGEIGLAEVDGEAEPGLVGIGVWRDVARPIEVTLLEPATFYGAIAGIGDAVRLARRPERVVDVRGELLRHIELVAEFTDIADAHRERAGEADVDLAGGEEGVGGVG